MTNSKPVVTALGNHPTPTSLDVARDLLRRKSLADHARSRPVAGRSAGHIAELWRTDRANAEMLRRVLAEHGWPGIPLVGPEAARAAWLIALRCDDAELQSTALTALAKAVIAGDARAAWWAHLYDRCCVLNGVAQRFGTQFRHGPGGVETYPVEDGELDASRAQYGLRPHAERLAAVRQRYGRAAA